MYVGGLEVNAMKIEIISWGYVDNGIVMLCMHWLAEVETWDGKNAIDIRHDGGFEHVDVVVCHSGGHYKFFRPLVLSFIMAHLIGGMVTWSFMYVLDEGVMCICWSSMDTFFL